MHLWWVTAHLYRKQMSIGIIAVTLGCCEPDVQSSTEQWEMHFALTSVAFHCWWVTAHLYEQQIFLGATAVKIGCCKPVLQSSTEQWVLHFAKISATVP